MLQVYIEKISSADGIEASLNNSLQWIGMDRVIPRGSKIFIKPNFTFPYYKEGVTTSPAVIESLVRLLKEFSADIIIGESDGGYYSWKAEDAFKGHHIDAITKRYDITALNLSMVERTYLTVFAKGREYKIAFPKFIKEEVDVFITMPVPKVHCMTGVSLAMKNQWGCIPDTMRLSFHHIFDEAILEITKNLPVTFVIADGIFFLDDTGPMYGAPLRKDLIIASNDIGSFEVTLCEIMGINIDEIPHLKYAKEKGVFPKDKKEIGLNCKLDAFKYESTMHRSVRNKMMYQCFKSGVLTHLLYTSSFGKGLHRFFYKLRGTPEHLKDIEQEL